MTEQQTSILYYLLPENDAEWVMMARKKLNINQMELALMSGVHNSVISRIENGNISCNDQVRRVLIRELKKKLGQSGSPVLKNAHGSCK